MERQEMKRNWDDTFFSVAMEISKHSTCCRRKVGAVAVIKNRIVSMGYNGTPSGMPHCMDVMREKFKEIIEANLDEVREWHKPYARLYEVHAEANVIAWAAKRGIPLEGSTLYCTLSPCSDCAKIILAAGVKRFYYLEQWKEIRPIEFLRDAGMECMDPRSMR